MRSGLRPNLGLISYKRESSQMDRTITEDPIEKGVAELHRVVLAYLSDTRRAENEQATRRERAFETISALFLEAIRSAGVDESPATQPTVPDAIVDPRYPLLDSITRPTVTTEEASYYLNRRPQTLRAWACHEDGPLRPLRVCGRLAWSVMEIKQLLDSAPRPRTGQTSKKKWPRGGPPMSSSAPQFK